MMKIKVCKECGKSFTPRKGTQVYCDGPHFTFCKICGKQITYTCSPKEKPTYCSVECRKEGKRRTVQERYGVDNVSELKEVRQKISKANSSEEVTSKRKATCLANWGVDNVSKNAEIRNKLSQVMKTDSYLSGREQTCIKRYGHSTPMRCESVKEKQRKTCIERYGMRGHPHSLEDFSKMMKDGSKVNNYIQFRGDPKNYILSNYDYKPTVRQLEEDLGVTNTPIYDILIRNDCSDLVLRTYSNMEDEVCDFLRSLLPDIIIERNNRSIIKPQEIDIYLPEHKIGIECNPASTHNSSVCDPWGQEPKYYKYHQMKSFAANDAGIFLFHIFGYEWVNKKDILKSMITNLLGLNSNSFGGRDTYIDEISHQECKQFLNLNHRQGYTSSKVRLGLRLKENNQLVSVMTFSHMRNTIGKTDDCSENDWELSRFCTKLDTNISGGASKLFKHFLIKYTPSRVISFSDVAHTRGNMYSNLGFRKESVSDPSYIWTDVYDNKYFHRVSCQKQHLRNLFNDPTIDIENLTEREIMESHKYVRVYDCGVIKWVYQNKSDLQ